MHIYIYILIQSRRSSRNISCNAYQERIRELFMLNPRKSVNTLRLSAWISKAFCTTPLFTLLKRIQFARGSSHRGYRFFRLTFSALSLFLFLPFTPLRSSLPIFLLYPMCQISRSFLKENSEQDLPYGIFERLWLVRIRVGRRAILLLVKITLFSVALETLVSTTYSTFGSSETSLFPLEILFALTSFLPPRGFFFSYGPKFSSTRSTSP